LKFIIVVLLFFSSLSFSQVDKPSRSSQYPAVDTSSATNKELLNSGRYVVTRKDSDLKENSTFSSKTLVTIPTGKYLEWVGYEFGYWKVKFGNHEGFINEILVECKDALKLYEENKNKLLARLNQMKDSIEVKTKWINEFKVKVMQDPTNKSYETDQLYRGIEIYLQVEQNGWCYILYDDPIHVNHRFDDENSFASSYKNGWIKKPILSDVYVSSMSESEIRRQQFILDNPGLSKKYKDAILNSAVMLKMTEEMVIASIGLPNDINRTVGSWGVHEQWVYYTMYLYFENGILTSWQD